ncbi:MAG: DNA recombination protein RmuC [Phycisphaerales bacterium JB063]
MPNTLLIITLALVLVAIILQAIVLLRQKTGENPAQAEQLARLEQHSERLPQLVRDEIERTRRDHADAADKLRTQLTQTDRANREEQSKTAKQQRDELAAAFTSFANTMKRDIEALGNHQRIRLNEVSENVGKLTEASDKKADTLRLAVEKKLDQLQQSNDHKLEKMRETVDEKLQSTLDKRLGESFKIVSERLEKVQRGLGEMQELATGVGDLKRVMTNVKTRGTWGEVLLGNLLEQVLTPEQYEKNCKVRPRSDNLVEFAVKLPGPDDTADSWVYLPIDSKFPKETYERIVAAADHADAEALERAQKELEAAAFKCARDIRDKYVSPPHTTDFAILFVPTEGLYAELLRRPGLVEKLQRECRVNLAGPTTLMALLNSLQMGFKTLAIQKRSGEVWKLLGGVKTEFGRFEQWIEAVQKKLHSATKEMDKAAVRTRQMTRKLSKVQELPTGESVSLLGIEDDGEVVLGNEAE